MQFDKLVRQIIKESELHDSIVFIGVVTDSLTWMGDVETYTLERAKRELGLKNYESGGPYFKSYVTKPVEIDNDLRDCMSETIRNILVSIEDWGEEEDDSFISLTEAEIRERVVDGFSPYLSKGLTGMWCFSAGVYGLLIEFNTIRSQQINKDLQDVDTTGFEDLL